MKHWKRLLLITAIIAGAPAVYSALILLAGFENMAIPIQFGRVAMATAGVVLFAPTLLKIFRETPTPRRDYFYVGIILMLVSAVCFAIWNETGRQYGLDTSIYTSPVAGFFSLLLVMGAGFCAIAPDMGGTKHRIIAIAVGIIAATVIVLIAPLFR